MISLENPSTADNPKAWTGMNIEEIIRLRSSLLRPYFSVRVEDARDPPYKLVEIQEAVMSKKPIDLSAVFAKKPALHIDFGSEIAPMGPKGPAKKIELEDTPRIDRTVEKLYYDDVKTEEAVKILYERGKDVYEISRLLSAGILGIQRNRRFVPTRWAITATDDMVYKHLRQKIIHNPPVDCILLFESHLFDNHFFIFFLPDVWAFELLEAWAPGSIWFRGKEPIILNDWEGFKGRKTYANNVGGSYYAARLAVLEKLREMKRQATVVILREVREGYYAPLGVWQVRENVRAALRAKPAVFSTIEEAFEFIRPRLRIPPERWFEKSMVLQRFKKQKKLLS